jgi:ATP-dependent Lhr-like helicase
MLARIKGRIVHMVLSRVSPLAVPVLLEIGRESVRSEADEEKLLAEAEAIIAEATGEADPPIKTIHRPNVMRRRAVQASLFQT